VVCSFNVSGIIGPALAGLLVPLPGANFVFALSVAVSWLVVLATRQGKQTSAHEAVAASQPPTNDSEKLAAKQIDKSISDLKEAFGTV
jgi:hypothetical protein